jgi:DNA (cytosine-5)-methyltransferase 1
LLDLFCCEGGASVGYERAGFDVTGVDLRPQPRYPFTFHQGDALAFVKRHGHEYDVIAASPPCPAYSEATPPHHRERLPMLIAPTREALRATGRPYVIENVENARAHLLNPIMLCGTMFGLPIWRHRYFEAPTLALLTPPCDHRGRPLTLHCGSNSRKTRGGTSVADIRAAMGIDWMSRDGLYEAIPPAFTEYLGRALLRALGHAEAA